MDVAWNLVLDFLAETAVEPVEHPQLDSGILGSPDIELALAHVDTLSQVAACNADSRRELQSPLSDWREALGRMTSSEIDQRLSFLQEHPLRGRLLAAVERIRGLRGDAAARQFVWHAVDATWRDPSVLLRYEAELWLVETELDAMEFERTGLP